MNNYTVIISNEFSAMANKCLSHLETFSNSYVFSTSLTLSYYILLLEKFPFAFSRFLLPNDNSFLRRIVINKRYLLLYQVTDNIVEMLYFVDGRRSYENMLTY